MPKWGEVTFRNPSAGTIMLLREMGCTLYDDLEQLAELSEAEAQEQVFAFLFVHGYAPPGVAPDDAERCFAAVLEAVALPMEEFRRRHLVPFAHLLPMPGLLAFVAEWLGGLRERDQRAVVEAVARGAAAQAESQTPEERDRIRNAILIAPGAMHGSGGAPTSESAASSVLSQIIADATVGNEAAAIR